jgi:hypothetical protein
MKQYRLLLVFMALALTHFAFAQVSGRVLESGSGNPIANAKVRVQADPNSVEVTSNALGQYSLPVTPTSQIGIAAYKAYDHSVGAVNYASKVEDIISPTSSLDIFLDVIPPHQLAGYTPSTGQSCGGCHTRQRSDWQSARHSQSARNPWVLDLFSGTGTPGGSAGYVYKNTHGVGESGFCATCHAPMRDVFNPGTVQLDTVSTAAGLDGVNCVACHQIAHVDASRINNLHAAGSIFGKTDYYFANDANAAFQVFGALPDVGTDIMRNIFNPLFKQPLLCASCHQYSNPANGTSGQSTYSEWLASPYAVAGPGFKTCQTCHMPEESGPGSIVGGGIQRPASQRHRHTFVGAVPSTLAQAILLSTQVAQVGNEIEVTVSVKNEGAGHAFPTGISIRNAILLVSAKKRAGAALAFASGATIPSWANDDVAGIAPGDLAGLPGKGFAKILSGRINGQGSVVTPVIFIDAEAAVSSAIPSGTTDVSTYRFSLPAGVTLADIDVDARLLYRRAFRALAVTKGWTQTPAGGPIEIEVARAPKYVENMLADGFE